ncbi:MAG: iron complex outermembrane receptor protein, partial [Brevundimonas sp.]
KDSRYYLPNLTVQKTFLDTKLTATLQWQNIDLGWLDSNEQSIISFKTDSFNTTTNYVYEVDMVALIALKINRSLLKVPLAQRSFSKFESVN